eukprot:scaffold98168_cov69-Phaeocystis_antarctica.AAC.2
MTQEGCQGYNHTPKPKIKAHAAATSRSASPTTASAWSISMAETVSGGMKRRVSKTDAVSSSRPRSRHARCSLAAQPAGALGGGCSSNPTMHPRPRTSRTHAGWAAAMARSPESNCSPRAAAFSTMPSSAKTSSVASAAAHATGLAAYVPPMAPAGTCFVSSARDEMAESGRPEAMPLAMTNTSGFTSSCWCAHMRPVRP